MRTMQEAGTPVPLPPLDVCGYLVGYLLEAGPAMSGGMGPVPLTASEIRAWSQITGRPLQPWEASWMLRLSREYVGQFAASDRPDSIAPWRDHPYFEERAQVVANHVRGALRSAATSKAKFKRKG
jgi:hypothetical protein